jgi:hypothetical protein
VVYEILDESNQGYVSFLGKLILNVSDFVLNVMPEPFGSTVAANELPVKTKRQASIVQDVTMAAPTSKEELRCC